VEDNPEMRGFIRVLLQKQYRVAVACDGLEGLQACRALGPDLVLSDVTMPRMSGVELCREVKQDPDLRFIPFVLLTSHTETQYRIEGFESGADDYLGKPFNVRELQARIRSLLDLRTAEKQLHRAHDDLKRAHEELQQTESQLVHSEKMASLGRLVAGVAHELNNPISFVYGNMNILQEYVDAIRGVLEAYRGAPVEDTSREALERQWQENDLDFVLEDLGGLIEGCREGALRTKQIVKDLRTFSRLDEAERKTVDIHQNLRSTLNLLSEPFSGRVRVHTEWGDLPEVECYAGQINQVFMNLLANAGQAMEAGGDIWIRTRFLPPDRVEIEIEDNGCGMSPEILSKIFDPFFTTKPVGTGTGLGLSITYGIVQRHGGSLSVKSEPGKGTCFTLGLSLTLPTENKGETDVQAAA
jgi:two-component system, NtrC family, sensor kinase